MKTPQDLAIVGIGCRYPGNSNTPEQFWELLLKGQDGFIDIPKDRWNSDRFQDPDLKNPGRMQTKQAAFIDTQHLKNFDSDFFGISSREAEILDPQQRLVLEVCWEAFEDAGIPTDDIKGADVGVYVGGFTHDNSVLRGGTQSSGHIDQFAATTSSLVMISNRLSYFFDLRGPSMTIDTACSSSMVALNYACRDIWEGKTSMAVVGGVNAMLNPNTFLLMAKGGFLSPDSRSKAFDIEANGYARGEGAGIVILKPLKDAVENQDQIYAVVKSVDINQDGRTPGIASPNPQAQETLIKSTFKKNNLDKGNVVLVEAHGTGTAVGDVFEVSALSGALGSNHGDSKRLIGSVKGNIGHQEAGAGIAGIIKTALCLHHDMAVPQANFKNLNPSLDLDTGSFEIPQSAVDLPEADGEKLACVNSFGYGGTNGHAVLAQYKPHNPTEINEEKPEQNLYVVSGKNEQSLQEQATQLQQLLTHSPELSLQDLSTTLLRRRSSLEYRSHFVASDLNEVIGGFQSIASGTSGFDTCFSSVSEGPVFVYTGMGPQWWGMGQQLYDAEPVFRKALNDADAAFESHSGWSILAEMLKPESESQMARNHIAQPANFILQSGLTKLLTHWGVTPSIIVGHSVGEVGAAAAAGALSLEDAAKVAFHRSRIQQTKAGQGRMLATGLDLKSAKTLESEHEGYISIAAINSPLSIALAGDEEVLQYIAAELDDNKVFNQFLSGEVAYHSYQMDSLEQDLIDALQGIEPQRPKLKLYSTVTGKRISKPFHDPSYWWRNVREPVQFHKVIKTLQKQGHKHFLEIGPNRVLSGAIRQCFVKDSNSAPSTFSVLSPKAEEQKNILSAIGQLWQVGGGLRTCDPAKGKPISLPKYKWQKKVCWYESEALNHFLHSKSEHNILGTEIFPGHDEWQGTLSSETQAMLKDHVINSRPVFPAAGYIESFLAVSRTKNERKTIHSLANVQFHAMLGFPSKESLNVRTTLTDGTLKFMARPNNNEGKWKLYASAKSLEKHMTPDGLDIPDYPETGWESALDKDQIYQQLSKNGLHYQSAFQVLEKTCLFDNRIIGHLKLQSSNTNNFVPPSLVDGGLQMLALLLTKSEGAPLPVGIRQIHLFQDHLPDELIAYGEFEIDRQGEQQGRLIFTDTDHHPVLFLLGIETKEVPLSKQNNHETEPQLYGFKWEPLELEHTSNAPNFLFLHHDPDSLLSNRLQKSAGKNAEDSYTSTINIVVCTQPDPLISNPEQDFQAMQAIVNAVESDKEKRIVICTQNAWRVNAGDPSHPSQGSLWGVVRALGKEIPSLNYVLVDLDGSQASSDKLISICSQMESGAELAIRNGNIYLKSISRNDLNTSLSSEPKHPINSNTSIVIEEGNRGGIDKLSFRSVPRKTPVSNEIEIEVQMVSINFKDVLKVLGALNDQSLKGTFFERALGMEATGRVVRTAPNNTTPFNVGDPVVFVSPDGCLRSHLTINPDMSWVQHASDYELAPDELCTVPTAFFSAHYALLNAGQLRKGQSVLLQSASGGLGLAALQVAKNVGAQIFATAGTIEKREFLHKLGIEHVFDSRSLDFEDQILKATDNRGVDVVLNFLPGDLMQSGIRVLADFGRFVELGKADIGTNGPLFLGQFERNLSFHAVDLDHMMLARRDLIKSISDEVQSLFKSGSYQALSHKVYPASEIRDLFRELAGGQHIGKRVVNMDHLPDRVLANKGGPQKIDLNATYIVTGGFSGLGLETAKHLVNEDAGCVVLIGRQVREDDDISALCELADQRHVKIIMLSCDASDTVAVSKMVNKVNTTAHPVRGIFHAAGILDDNIAAQQTEQSFRSVYGPKVHGAVALHKASIEHNLELDFFVLFSSISASLGNAGQTNYAGSNAYLDGIAEYRRSMGLTASSIAWGAIGGAGMVARDPSIERVLNFSGIDAIPVEKAISTLFSILPKSDSNTCIFQVDWNKWGRAVKPRTGEPSSELIKYEKSAAAKGPIIDQMRNLTSEDAIVALLTVTRAKLGEVYQKSPESIATDQPLVSMGLDSLMLAEFVLSVEEEIGIEIDFDLISAESSLNEITKILYTHIKSEILMNTEDLSKQAAE